MLGVLLVARPSVASRAFCCLDIRTTILILVFTASKMKQSMKTPLVWAFIFQNANPEVCLHTRHSVQFHLSQTLLLIFQGSGSETIIHSFSIPSLLFLFMSPSLSCFPSSPFSPMWFSRGGGGGGGGAQLTKANKKIDDLQHKVMQKTEELMEMHKRQTESAEKIAGLTAQLRSKEEECTKKDSR